MDPRTDREAPAFFEQPVTNRISSRGPLVRYGFAFLCMLAAFWIRYALTPWLGEELPFMLFVGASLVAAWYGGAVAGVVALLLGLFLSDYFFLTRGTVGIAERIEALHVLRYLFTASLGIFLIEVLHRNQRRLEREIARRYQSETELFRAHQQLRRHAQELDSCVADRTARLSETVEALRSLLYHMAHNLRSPLRAVQGFTSLLAQEYAPKLDATAQEYSHHICDATARMDDLIHDLLEYGRLGYIHVELEDVQLDEVLERVLFRAAHQIQTARAEVKTVQPMPTVTADPALLEQVLASLLENAIKFVAPGRTPRVNLHAERCQNTVRVWVEDNGIGIDQQYRERIFGVFETLHPRQGFEGTGMGLAIVKQGVLKMGGQVGVESAPGAGSRFWIELPAAGPSEEQQLFRRTPASQTPSTPRAFPA